MAYPTFIQALTQVGSIALGIIGISFLVAIHELGHFFCCKLFNVHTPSFSIGFGPRLYTKKIGDTEFSLSALPLGGYVEIAGMEEVAQGTQEHAHAQGSTSFAQKSYLQKMIIIMGGIIVNISFAYIALVGIFHFYGIPSHPLFIQQTATNSIKSVLADGPAAQAGIQAQDILIGLDTTTYTPTTIADALSYLRNHAGQKVVVHVLRNGSTLDIPVQLSEGGQHTLGIELDHGSQAPLSWKSALAASGSTVLFWIKNTFGSLKNMCVKRTTQGLGGPIAVIHTITHSANKGFIPFLVILCFISVGIACLNLVPLPIFDGGQALFYTLEAISGRSLNDIRLWVHYISWAAVVALMLFLSWKDIMRIIFGA